LRFQFATIIVFNIQDCFAEFNMEAVIRRCGTFLNFFEGVETCVPATLSASSPLCRRNASRPYGDRTYV
jgi:hypothetical protein